MIDDFDQFDDGAHLTADVCVIGAGAAGITIAKEFLNTSRTVLVLESGGFDIDARYQKLYESDVAGLPHAGVNTGRARVFGGTTTLWGGQALRFDTLDLAKRDWVPYSGWPLTCADLDPYYERAERVLQIGRSIPYDELCASFGITPPAFDRCKLYMECSQWSPRPNFGKTYRRELKSSRNVTVLLHANVTAIVTNQRATGVEHVELTSLNHKKATAAARLYVICCGGIETARLLLASDRVEPSGVANSRGLVGRFFQEHIHIRFGELVPANRAHVQELFESFYVDGLKYAPKMTLGEQVRAAAQVLNVHGELTFEQAHRSGAASMKAFLRGLRSGSSPAELTHLFRNGIADPGELLRLGYRFYVKKRSGSPKVGPVYIGAQSEMAPNPESRVLLSDTTDELGMRRIILDWRLGELERRTASECLRAMVDELERLGLGAFDRKQFAALETAQTWLPMAHDSSHHMGTTRMHETPQWGVVDPQCKVHGISNLYIGSSAVFPTSARSNPTLTILALCIRIADRLKELL